MLFGEAMRGAPLLMMLLPLATSDSVLSHPGSTAVGRSVNIELQLNRTEYGIVEVIRFEQPGHPAIRFLRCGLSIVGADFIDEEYEGQCVFRNFGILQTVAFKPASGRRLRMLQLGLGAGTVPSYLRSNGIVVDVVEINADVVEAAKIHYGYDKSNGPMGRTHIMDALEFFKNYPSVRYDAVIHDLFTGVNPLMLLESSLISTIWENWLADDGVLLVDYFGYQHAGVGSSQSKKHGHDLSMSVQATLEQVFGAPPFVRCFREIDPMIYREKPANLIFMAWKGNPPNSKAPFIVPDDPDYPTVEGSSFWVQQHYFEFEVTDQLRTVTPGFASTWAIDTTKATQARADNIFTQDYRDLLTSFFPPAIEWFEDAGSRHDHDDL